jgi:ABC-2 type transport system permease protein
VTTGTTARPGAPPRDVREPGSAGRAATGAAVALVRRGTVVVAVVAGVLPAFVAFEYRDTFSGAVGVSSLMGLAENPAIRTLFGRPVALDDPGGFTVWRLGTVLAVLVGVWAVLTATRLTRGEEEAGRWDLLLSGQLRLRSLVGRSLVVLLAATAVVGAGVAAGMLLSGTGTTGALLFAAVIGGTGMVGAGLGAVAAQLLPERRAASGLGIAVLLAGLLVRMVADGVPALAWAQWLSPFGLMARAEPFGANRTLPLLVLAGAVAGLVTLTVVLAGRRDTGAGLLAGRDVRSAGSGLLGSVPALAVHRSRRPVLGWALGIGLYFLLIGSLATTMMQFLRDNPLFAQMAATAGFGRLASVQGYVAALFTLLAIPIGAFAAARMSAAAADESAGRLTLLFSLPVARARWAATEAVAAALGCVVLAVVAGLTTWAGARAVDAPLGIGESVAGALSVVPVALLCLGAALAALGWVPQAVLPVGVLPAAGGYLLLVFAESFHWPGWVRGIAPFAHLSAVPAEPMDVAGALGMLVVALLLGVLGLVGYARRDLRA